MHGKQYFDVSNCERPNVHKIINAPKVISRYLIVIIF